MASPYFEKAVGEFQFQGFTTAVSRSRGTFGFCGTAMNSSRPVFLCASIEQDTDGHGEKNPFVIQRLGANGELNISAVIELPPNHPIFKAKLRDNEELELKLVIGVQHGACKCSHVHQVAHE